MRLLVFGKTGQVATSISRMKTNADHPIEIVCAGRPATDITSQSAVLVAIEQARPDIVINAAAYTAVDNAESEADEAMNINCLGAANVASSADHHNLPVIHFSTDYVFSGDKRKPYQETDETSPRSVYGSTKLAGERAVQDANPKHVILRTSWVYSPTGHNFVKTMLMLAQTRDELNVVADQFGNPTSADEIARAVLTVSKEMQRPDFDAWGVYHFTGPESVSWAEFAEKVFALAGKRGGPSAKVSSITTADYPTAARRPLNSRLCNKKFLANFPFEHQSLEDSLDEAVKYLLA